MKDASTWARQVVADVVAAARASGDLGLETELLGRIERRLRQVQLEAVRDALAECKTLASTLPRLSALGASRCVNALADLSLKVHSNRQVPADA